MHEARIDLAAVRDNAAVLTARAGHPVAPDPAHDGLGHGVLEQLPGTPSADAYGLAEDRRLRPAMRVSALVVGVKTIEAGEGVSYGYTYRAPRRTNLALVGIGYADGVDRFAGNRSLLLLRGVPRLIAGRVAMNALVLELGDDTASVGDEAVLFGDPRAGEPHIASWAAALGKSAEEIAIAFGSHLPRRYV